MGGKGAKAARLKKRMRFIQSFVSLVNFAKHTLGGVGAQSTRLPSTCRAKWRKKCFRSRQYPLWPKIGHRMPWAWA